MYTLLDYRICVASVSRPSTRVTPVSYTHLDVYKRQVSTYLCALVFLSFNSNKKKVYSVKSQLSLFLLLFVSATCICIYSPLSFTDTCAPIAYVYKGSNNSFLKVYQFELNVVDTFTERDFDASLSARVSLIGRCV